MQRSKLRVDLLTHAGAAFQALTEQTELVAGTQPALVAGSRVLVVFAS